MLMGANHPYCLSDRIHYLIKKFTKKHKLSKVQIQWDEDELSELSRDLSQYIRDSMVKWNRNKQRLDHMRLRHLQVKHEEMELIDSEKSFIGPVQQ